MYAYKSPVGLMKIYIDRNVGRYALDINGIIVGHYLSAADAADDVYTQVTGYYDWDDLDGDVDPPSDLSEWLIVN
ncbi:hypothetical protein B7C51_06920 [Paenibacillus larvae subsp. pulvifaciens]|uniref:Uncharacterized protein n=1 Tax=Paenibacillus larvae subsp. pulvifaciens TaxID=1477 RepID=A0A1V0URF9_9BACL|nr:hypothetical protein [Paenibacillus larvae]ARF67620.1 hypothetical protein B7C51_06920 [Paenibacillus larvae subsp. pulvifaciens]